MSELIPILAGAALPIAAGWSLGRWLLRDLGLPGPIHLAAGSALLSTVIFFLLTAHLAHLPVLVATGLLCLAPLLRHRNLRLTVPWFVVLPGLLYLPYALAPEIQTDALNYHLRLATEALRSGGFPAGVGFYEVLPQGIETLFAFAYSIGRDSAAKLVHFAFFLATLPLIQRLAVRLGAPNQGGWLAAWLYALTPVVAISAVSSFNDAAMVFYILATFTVMLEWWERGDDRLLWVAGICAGFCYALKFTGGLIAPLAVVVILSRRNVRGAAILAAGTLAMAAPWILRAAILTGNPFAPLLNSLFPNPYFHIQTEQNLGQYLRDYGGVTWSQIPAQLLFRGDLLQGLLGPAWLALPIAMLALRQRSGRLLWGAGVLAAAPWLLNIGTRFLMPGLPFFAIALMLSLPRLPVILLTVAHGVLSLPVVLALYTPVNAWVLPPQPPWQAALRLEPTPVYLQRTSEDWNISQLLAARTKPTDRIFDMANAPAAITPRELVNAWQHPLGDHFVQVLQTGATTEAGWMVEWTARFPEQPVDGLRLNLGARRPQPAVLHEITLLRADGTVVEPAPLWSIGASPNIWEAPLALDRSLVTAWSTWEPVKPGMFYQVELPAPERIAAIRIIGHRDTASVPLTLELRTAQAWSAVSLSKAAPRAALNLRIPAMNHFKQQGITYIFGQYGEDGLGRLTKDLHARLRDWNIRLIEEYKGIALFHIE